MQCVHKPSHIYNAHLLGEAGIIGLLISSRLGAGVVVWQLCRACWQHTGHNVTVLTESLGLKGSWDLWQYATHAVTVLAALSMCPVCCIS